MLAEIPYATYGVLEVRYWDAMPMQAARNGCMMLKLKRTWEKNVDARGCGGDGDISERRISLIVPRLQPSLQLDQTCGPD